MVDFRAATIASMNSIRSCHPMDTTDIILCAVSGIGVLMLSISSIIMTIDCFKTMKGNDRISMGILGIFLTMVLIVCSLYLIAPFIG